MTETAAPKRRKRRIKRVLVTAQCQYPCEHFGHKFEYLKTTKPREYCEEHEKGYLEDSEDGKQHMHGGRRNVRPSDGGGKRLVAEEQVTSYGFVKHVEGQPTTSINGGLYAESQRLGWLGSLFSNLYHWRRLPNDPGVGDNVTTTVLVTGRDGKPRWNPALWRSLTVDEREVQPEGVIGLDGSLGEDGRGGQVMALDRASMPGEYDQQRAPGPITQTHRPAILPGEQVTSTVVDGRRAVKVVPGVTRWLAHAFRNRHTSWGRAAMARVKADDPALYEAIYDAYLTAAIRVSAVQSGDSGTSRTTTEGANRV